MNENSVPSSFDRFGGAPIRVRCSNDVENPSLLSSTNCSELEKRRFCNSCKRVSKIHSSLWINQGKRREIQVSRIRLITSWLRVFGTRVPNDTITRTLFSFASFFFFFFCPSHVCFSTAFVSVKTIYTRITNRTVVKSEDWTSQDDRKASRKTIPKHELSFSSIWLSNDALSTDGRFQLAFFRLVRRLPRRFFAYAATTK